MNDLYNELTSSNTHYLENGEMRSNPPSPLQLRAARAIKQYFEEGQGLSRAHMQLQQEFAQLNEELNNLKAKYADKEVIIPESVCDSRQETSAVGSGD